MVSLGLLFLYVQIYLQSQVSLFTAILITNIYQQSTKIIFLKQMQDQQQQYNWVYSNKNAQINTFNLNLTKRKIFIIMEK